MFFLWFMFNTALLASGGYVCWKGETSTGLILLACGILSFIGWFVYYRNRKRKKDDMCWVADGLGEIADVCSSSLFKKLDCDCDGDCFDCPS